MKNTSISLGNYFDQFVSNQVSNGRYKNVSELIRAALRLLENEESKIVAIRNAIQEGIDSGIAHDFDPEISKFTPAQIQSYEDSLKYYRDLKNSLDTAKEEKAIEIAKKAIAKGYSIDEILELTDLTREQVEKIISNNH